MRIKIDLDLCQGHGVCVAEAPDVFELDEDAHLARLQIAEPGESQREAVRKAAKYCPTFAITIED